MSSHCTFLLSSGNEHWYYDGSTNEYVLEFGGEHLLLMDDPSQAVDHGSSFEVRVSAGTPLWRSLHYLDHVIRCGPQNAMTCRLCPDGKYDVSDTWKSQRIMGFVGKRTTELAADVYCE